MASKHKSGLDYLKEKYAELEKDVKRLKIESAEKDGVIEKQTSTISKLTAERDAAKADAAKARLMADEYWYAMGKFRRLLFGLENANK